LLNRGQDHHHSRGDDRERITRARQAAEALFAPKKQVTNGSATDSGTSAEQPVRKPRVLATSSTASVRDDEAATPVVSERQTAPEIPEAQFARIRAWIEYGMTVAQVAEVCGVAVGEVERVLRQF
jgi:hypothetical protein